MNSKLIITILFIFIGFQQVSARISIGKSENIKVVHEFPNTEDYMTDPGRFVDLAILYETFDIAGVPLWVTKDPVLVGTENLNTEYYFDIDSITANEIVAENDLNMEELTSLSFMDKHGGFVYLAIVIAAILIYTKFFGPKDEDEIEIIEDENPVIVKKD